jgi:hypothetical protein
MKKNIFRAYALMAVAVVFSSCNNAAPKMDEEPVAEAVVDAYHGVTSLRAPPAIL